MYLKSKLMRRKRVNLPTELCLTCDALCATDCEVSCFTSCSDSCSETCVLECRSTCLLSGGASET